METESSPIDPLGQVRFGAGNVFANWGCGKRVFGAASSDGIQASRIRKRVSC
jgi:hypothetical protein